MTTVQLPGKVFFEFEKDDLPPGPTGPTGGVLQKLHRASFGPVSIATTVSTATGIKKTVEVDCPRVMQIELRAYAGHNTVGAAVQVYIARNGVILPLVGAAHGSARLSDSKDIRPLLATVYDEVEAGTYEYEVFALQTSAAPSSYGYIGRRGDPGFVHDTLLLISELSAVS